jgi:hypothetical protein
LEKKMKKTLNLALITAMFATFAIAEDGNQGSGGRTCDPTLDPACHPVANPMFGGSGDDTAYEMGFGEIVLRVVTDTIAKIR